MKKLYHIFGLLSVLVLGALLMAPSGSCGKKSIGPGLAGGEPALKSGRTVLNAFGRPLPPLEDVLADLEALPRPESVDPQLWGSLKAGLRNRLLSAYGGGKRVAKLQTSPPANSVLPRHLRWEPSGGPDGWGKLTWRYVCDGDYNESGRVEIADITPLAIHYGKEGPFIDNSIEELIDEDDDVLDGDGRIEGEDNQLGAYNDLHTIAMNFNLDVASYEVYGREAQGNWVLLGTVPFSSREQLDGERDISSFPLNETHASYRYFKVRALSATPGTLDPPLGPEYWYHTNDRDPEGSIIESSVLELGPPVVTSVHAPSGVPNEPITFRADVSGASPHEYSWTFCQYADPQTSTVAAPIVTFSNVVMGIGTVQVTNRFGASAVFPFFIDIRSEMPPDIHGISPSPAEGDTGTEIAFSAEVTGAPAWYSWDFGGGVDPSASNEPAPTVTLTDPGPPYLASLTVGNDRGLDMMEFQVIVHGWAIVDVDTVSIGSNDLCMARDQNDEPGISYRSDKQLKYAWRTGDIWGVATADPGMEIPGVRRITVGQYNSLAFNPEPSAPGVPEPSIAYKFTDSSWDEDEQGWHEDSFGIRFVRFVEGQWEIHPYVPNDEGGPDEPSLAFDGSKPYISYYKDFGNCDLRLAFEEPVGSGFWGWVTVEAGGGPSHYRGQESSMVVDSSGRKLIAHHSLDWQLPNPPESQLRLVRYTDMLCLPEVVDVTTSGDTGHHSSIALTAAGSVWIAYLHDFSGHGLLKVARESFPSGGPWAFDLLDAGGRAGPPSLKISTGGVAGISYSWRPTELDEPVLKLVRNINGVWSDPLVVTENTSDSCSLAFTSDGRPTIAFVSSGENAYLRYAELW